MIADKRNECRREWRSEPLPDGGHRYGRIGEHICETVAAERCRFYEPKSKRSSACKHAKRRKIGYALCRCVEAAKDFDETWGGVYESNRN